jgi:transcriptional regulator with GAF, ATPase, and Fis domain
LLLDEVSELPLAAQAKLLQLLQSRSYYPLGSNRPSSADVRVVAATNADLERAVAERRFRSDLYYRYTSCRSAFPRSTSGATTSTIWRWLLRRCGRASRVSQRLALGAAIRTLRAMEWPGHVRQLEHAVEAPSSARRPRARRKSSHPSDWEPGRAHAGSTPYVPGGDAPVPGRARAPGPGRFRVERRRGRAVVSTWRGHISTT